MNRREFLKNLSISTAITPGGLIPILDGLTLPPIEEISLDPQWTRTFYLRTEYDFDRMSDKYIIACRFAPMKDWSKGTITFRKHAVGFYLPEGTPTPGLNALSLLLQGIKDAD
jgi:hypothetical protein